MRKNPLPNNKPVKPGPLKMPDDHVILHQVTRFTLPQMAAKNGVSEQTVKLHLRRLGVVPGPLDTWASFMEDQDSAAMARKLLKGMGK